MGLQEIQNERFENSEVMGKYWPKQDSEVLKEEQEDRVLLLREFLIVCQENHLRIKPKKCEFMQEEMEY